jgi:hypothetical protein
MSGVAVAGSAQAAFIVESPPTSKPHLNLTAAKDTTSSTGTVVTANDVLIQTNVDANFASGFSTIKPVKGQLLTDLIFTPTNPNLFTDFTFRGQDIAANQTIDVVVTDENGVTQTLPFSEGKANEDFGRQGIIANLAGETIKSVELVDSGGFEEAKQFSFSFAGAVVPEPATWAMMLMGLGTMGAAMRARRRNASSAAA